MAHSVLLIPVREAEFVVRPRLERVAPTYLPTDPDEVAAHITLLGPFADLAQLDDGVLSELLSFFADVTPFEFRLTKVCSFPGGLTYLAPDPASPFRQLTHELSRQFPEFPPYGGEFDQVVPHLSVGTAEHSDPPDQVASELSFRLPITAHAQEAALYWYEQEGCRVVETFPFGTTAA